MTNLPEPKELHERAATSAKETRSTIISLSTASIGGLFFIATKPAEAVQFTGHQKFVITSYSIHYTKLYEHVLVGVPH